jgi:hypothetical protein
MLCSASLACCRNHSTGDLLHTDLQEDESFGFSHTALKKENLMLHRTLWTWRSFTGIVLLLGGVLFQGSAWIPLTIGPPTPLTDSKGTAIYLLPPQAALDVVLHHQALWWWTNTFFMVGTLVTMLGLALLTMLFRQAGDRIFSHLGLILFVVGATLWVIQRAVPLSIDPWAAQELARTGVMPDYYVPLTLWTQALFVIYSLLAYCALIAYGGAILSTRLLPRWMGWLAIVYGLLGLGLTGFTAGALPGPWFQYVLPMVMGILLLLRRAQVPSAQDEPQKAASA